MNRTAPASPALSLPVLPARGVRTEELADALRHRLGDDGTVVRFGRHDRMLYSTDASIYQVEPIGVVVPRSIDEAVAAIRICAEFGVPVLPRGGGTALAGQTVNSAVVIDLSQRCRRIIEIDAEGRRARVEPGVVLDQLNAACLPHGLMFGPDVATSSHATLGGMIGNNSAGAWSIRYGRTVEHLVGVEVALADGTRVRLDEGAALRDPVVRDLSERVIAVVRELAPEIRARYPRIRRHVDGYNLDLMLDQIERSARDLAPGDLAAGDLAAGDLAPGGLAHLNLAHLICGSEGTLATTLEATLNLVERPKARGLAIAAFADVDGAMDALNAILRTDPAAVELVDDVVIAMALANNECRPFVEVMPKPGGKTPGAVLYVEYFADTLEEVAERFGALAGALPGAEIARHTDPVSMQAAWRLRKSGEPLLHAIPGARKPVTFVEDTAVDPSRLPEFVREFRAIVARHGTTAAYYAHASVGCLHIRPLVCLRSTDDLRVMESIAGEVADLVQRYDGALSGEHGDGRVRSPFLERYFGPALCEGFRRIRAIFDPEGRMNPGNITDPAPMTSHLRVRPQRDFVTVPATPTFYRYEREHGFDHAVEMCNGAGICRRLTPGGTMCPSYRALLDERHATRGRGNALRLAISGQIGAKTAAAPSGAAPSWNDPETLDTLRLCLSCKACKTECPSNVDIAKLRSEYLAQGIEAKGASLATLAIGNVRILNRLASITPTLATAVAGSAPGRWLAERLVGIDRRRSLPPFAKPLHAWMRSRSRPEVPHDAPTVILFPDCFTVYSEPRIGMAAVTALESCGYRVILPEPATGVGCCGRSMMSVGLLRQAVRTVRATATALREQVKAHRAVAIVGCEPSCISALRDDWLELDLGPDYEWIRGLAAQSALVEQFIDERWESHPRRPELATAVPDSEAVILLHGHCHQKALWGVETSARLLRRIAGDRLQVLQTGCCGMAGSFGMTTDRYDLSMQIGELELLPAVRSAPENAIVCAPGTSCRHQIHDGAGRRAQHPIEVFARMVRGGGGAGGGWVG